ncbi:MAG: hypothetical protein SGPRY_008631 [Prymnesium sp.]
MKRQRLDGACLHPVGAWPLLGGEEMREVVGRLPPERGEVGTTLLAAARLAACAAWLQSAPLARAVEREAWAALHCGAWRDVERAWRGVYMAAAHYASAAECAIALDESSPSTSPNHSPSCRSVYLQALRTIDLGLMLGDHTFRKPLLLAAKLLEDRLASEEGSVPPAPVPLPSLPPAQTRATSVRPLSGVLPSLPVFRLPSLPFFYNECMLPSRPALLTHLTDSWPARRERRWSDLTYLKAAAGHRTVPVEVAEHYLDPQFDEHLMTLSEFIEKYIEHPPAIGRKGYLAQHQLFDHLPRLRADVEIPDYCALSLEESESEDGEGISEGSQHDQSQRDQRASHSPQEVVRINAWFGPAGTLSPLHQDRYHNLLAQVFGSKYVRLYAPTEENCRCLYPHESGPHKISSQIVDPDHVDSARFPLFGDALYVDLLLREGDVLYIPPFWWHFIESCETSFSVSFWWI